MGQISQLQCIIASVSLRHSALKDDMAELTLLAIFARQINFLIHIREACENCAWMNESL